jgi:hypothetical protein
MNEKTYPSDLTDEEWEWIKDLIVCFRQARVNLDFPWLTVILVKATR